MTNSRRKADHEYTDPEVIEAVETIEARGEDALDAALRLARKLLAKGGGTNGGASAAASAPSVFSPSVG